MKLFNIPAGPLHEALEAYSAATGTALIYDSALAQRKRSRAVVGLFTNEVALRMMLEGSDLTIRYNSPTDVMLVSLARANAEAAAAGDGDPGRGPGTVSLVLDTLYVDVPTGTKRPDFTSYSRIVVNQLRSALAHDPDTADRIYQVQLDIWINDQGRLRHPRFVRSTGGRRLDDAIRRAVEEVTLKTLPPKGMPQPLRLTIIAI